MASVIIHIGKTTNDKNYILKVLGIHSRTNRDYRYDWLRVLAILMVITTHAIQADLSLGLIMGKKKIFIFTILYMFCLACNLIYVMLSGALLIPYRKESLGDFYLKRVTKVAFPMIIYFVFYLWQNEELEGHISKYTVQNIFIRLLTGDTPESPQYWLMYTILSLYIVFPFFRYMFNKMPYRLLSVMVVIGICLMTVTLFSPISLKVSSFLGTWDGVAIMGYWVTRPETRERYNLLIGFGIAALGFMMVMIWRGLDYETLCCNTSPIMVLISLGIFAFVFRKESFCNKGNAILGMLSKYSYSIILIHWWVLHWITRGQYNIQVASYHGGGVIISLMVTIVVSLFWAFLIDNYVMTFIQQSWEWIIIFVKKLVNKKSVLKGS